MSPFAAPTSLTPSIELTTPPAGANDADDLYQIKVSIKNVSLDDTWDLYFISEVNESKGTPVMEGISVQSRTINWVSADLPSGRYDFYARLHSGDSVVTAAAPGYLNVDHPGNENSSPTVTITSPVGGETYTAGTTVNIAYTPTDADNDILSYQIDYSSDGKDSWTTLEADSSATTYAWDIPTSQTPGPDYYLRVTVFDDDDADASYIIPNPFQIVAP